MYREEVIGTEQTSYNSTNQLQQWVCTLRTKQLQQCVCTTEGIWSTYVCTVKNSRGTSGLAMYAAFFTAFAAFSA
jgi:hypothetical protein